MNSPVWKPRATKLQTYEALYVLNRCFEATLLGLERLQQLRLFGEEHLNEYKATLEYLRAKANDELTDALRENEMVEAAYFDQIPHGLEKQREDPDDVFLAENARKQQVKQQIKALQRSLAPPFVKRKKR